MSQCRSVAVSQCQCRSVVASGCRGVVVLWRRGVLALQCCGVAEVEVMVEVVAGVAMYVTQLHATIIGMFSSA